MRIPRAISENTFKAYQLPASNIYFRGEIKSGDFTWDENFIETLQQMCLNVICKNWEKQPLCDEIIIPSVKATLFELLPTTLPLELTVGIIDDEGYWERSYFDRWPNAPMPNREAIIPRMTSIPNGIDEHVNDNSVTTTNNNLSDEYSASTETNLSENVSELNKNSPHSSNIFSTDKTLQIPLLKKWKQCFFEKYVDGELERMKPDMFNEEYIQELIDLCGDYIVSIHLNSLKASKPDEPVHHISLHYLVENLPNLLDFSVCFNEANLADNFSWHSTKVSENDCLYVGNGVAKSNIEIFRLVRSGIDCEKLKLIIRPLCGHKTLRILDLSRCHIGDKGAKALAAMLRETPAIEIVNLSQNQIGAIGAEGLAYYLCQPESAIKELILKLNPLGVEGGKYLATALTRGALTLRVLSMSACGLTSENEHIGNAMSLNTTLQKLDLSNNHLGEDTGHCFLAGLERNETLLHLDLRMTDIPDDILSDIHQIVLENLKKNRGILKTTVYANDIM